MKIFLIITFHLSILVSLSFAQSQNIDSLISISKNHNNKIASIEALFELAKIYKYDSTELAEKYSLKALSISTLVIGFFLIVVVRFTQINHRWSCG